MRVLDGLSLFFLPTRLVKRISEKRLKPCLSWTWWEKSKVRCGSKAWSNEGVTGVRRTRLFRHMTGGVTHSSFVETGDSLGKTYRRREKRQPLTTGAMPELVKALIVRGTLPAGNQRGNTNGSYAERLASL